MYLNELHWQQKPVELLLIIAILLIIKRWIDFYKDRNLVPFPATVVDIALFFSHLTSIGVSASVIETVYSALKWVHDIAGLANPISNPFVKTVVEGAKRETVNQL